MKRRALISAVLAFTLLGAGCSQGSDEPGVFNPVPIDPFLGEAVLGDPGAPVEIIEYASTTCGHCKAFHDEVLPQLKAAYIDTGQAKLVYRVLPTQPGALSMAGAAIARCAGESQFFDVIDALFENQDALLASGSEAAVRAGLTEIGSRHGLSPDETRTCIDSEEIRTVTIRGVEESPDFVDSTPTLIVNGRHVEDYSFESLSAAIDATLAGETPDHGPG